MTRQLVIPWAYWRRHHVGFLIVFGWWLALSAAYTLGPARTLEPFAGILATVPFGLSVLYVVAVFCHAFETDMIPGESGYPRRAFTLPLPSWALAFWLMAPSRYRPPP